MIGKWKREEQQKGGRRSRGDSRGGQKNGKLEMGDVGRKRYKLLTVFNKLVTLNVE